MIARQSADYRPSAEPEARSTETLSGFADPLQLRCRVPKIPLPCDTGDDAQVRDIQAIIAENRDHSACRFAFLPDGRGISSAPNGGFGSTANEAISRFAAA